VSQLDLGHNEQVSAQVVQPVNPMSFASLVVKLKSDFVLSKFEKAFRLLFLIDAHLNVQKFITTLEHALAHV
jgi:hypothetical protein